MKQILFYKSFSFRTIILHSFRHTDNSKGIPCHFVGRMHSGNGIIRAVSGEELHLSAGDIFYLPAGLQYHSYWKTDKTGDRSVSWESYGFTHLPIPSETRYAMQKIYPSADPVYPHRSALYRGASLWGDGKTDHSRLDPQGRGRAR